MKFLSRTLTDKKIGVRVLLWMTILIGVTAVTILVGEDLFAQAKVNTIVPAGTRIPMRAGQIDCVGFPDYNLHALHASCTLLGENRMYGSLDLNLPNAANASTTGRLGTADWVEFSLVKEAGANRWKVTNSAGQTATGTF